MAVVSGVDHRPLDLILGSLLPLSLAIAVVALGDLVLGGPVTQYGYYWTPLEFWATLFSSLVYSVYVGAALYRLVCVDLSTGTRESIVVVIVIISSTAATLHATLASLYPGFTETIFSLLSFVVPFGALVINIRLIATTRPGLAVGFLGLNFLAPVFYSLMILYQPNSCAHIFWPQITWRVVGPVVMANSLFVPLLIFANDLKAVLKSTQTLTVVVVAIVMVFGAMSLMQPEFATVSGCNSHFPLPLGLTLDDL
jgi:hypothetical protein